VKHDGHRLAVIAGSGEVRLLSRNGYERTKQFGSVFCSFAELGREIVLDGEIAAPDERHRSGAIPDGVLQAVSL
jgi:bifunctional non-homologous end joining protein LigD